MLWVTDCNCSEDGGMCGRCERAREDADEWARIEAHLREPCVDDYDDLELEVAQ